MSQLYAVAFPESNSAAPSCDCLAHVYGDAADHGERVRRYPSDMTDAEWAVVRSAMPVPVPGWLEGRGGQPEGYCHRQMIDAVRYLVDNGIKWRAMPGDFPVWDRVYAFYRRWRNKGLVQELHDRLRGKVREMEGRDGETISHAGGRCGWSPPTFSSSSPATASCRPVTQIFIDVTRAFMIA